MTTSSAHAAPSRARDDRSVFRAVVLFPASATLIALIVTLLRGAERPVAPGGEALQPDTTPSQLPEPSFGPPMAGVHSAADAVQSATGWVVLDGREEQLVFLDSQARLVRRVGGRGPGPGELMRAHRVALMDSSVVVADAAGIRLDVFSHEGFFLRRISLEFPGCGAAPLRELQGGPDHVVILRMCQRTNGRIDIQVERVSATGERMMLEERLFSDLREDGLDPTRMPVLAPAGSHLYLGVTPDPCVSEVDMGGEPTSKLCHPDPHPVPLPDSMRAQLRALSPRLEGTGARLVVPDRYPPFEDILEVDGRLAFLTILDDRARALDVVNGNRLERTLLPLDAKVFVGARGLLLARDELEGTAFAILPLP